VNNPQRGQKQARYQKHRIVRGDTRDEVAVPADADCDNEDEGKHMEKTPCEPTLVLHRVPPVLNSKFAPTQRSNLAYGNPAQGNGWGGDGSTQPNLILYAALKPSIFLDEESRWLRNARVQVLEDGEYRRRRANKIRVSAASLPDVWSRWLMNGMAEEYDRLAERADARLRARQCSLPRG
jgi:hypothetical protein